MHKILTISLVILVVFSVLVFTQSSSDLTGDATRGVFSALKSRDSVQNDAPLSHLKPQENSERKPLTSSRYTLDDKTTPKVIVKTLGELALEKSKLPLLKNRGVDFYVKDIIPQEILQDQQKLDNYVINYLLTKLTLRKTGELVILKYSLLLESGMLTPNIPPELSDYTPRTFLLQNTLYYNLQETPSMNYVKDNFWVLVNKQTGELEVYLTDWFAEYATSSEKISLSNINDFEVIYGTLPTFVPPVFETRTDRFPPVSDACPPKHTVIWINYDGSSWNPFMTVPSKGIGLTAGVDFTSIPMLITRINEILSGLSNSDACICPGSSITLLLVSHGAKGQQITQAENWYGERWIDINSLLDSISSVYLNQCIGILVAGGCGSGDAILRRQPRRTPEGWVLITGSVDSAPAHATFTFAVRACLDYLPEDWDGFWSCISNKMLLYNPLGAPISHISSFPERPLPDMLTPQGSVIPRYVSPMACCARCVCTGIDYTSGQINLSLLQIVFFVIRSVKIYVELDVKI